MRASSRSQLAQSLLSLSSLFFPFLLATMNFREKPTPDLSDDRQNGPPTVDACVVHLKLIEAFSTLRLNVGKTDGLYGLWDRLTGGNQLIIAKMREKRWAIFVTLAARRFERWFERLPPSTKCTLDMMDAPSYASTHDSVQAIQFSPDTLPPLDVLMIWHAFCLNPHKYFSDCVRLGRLDLWRSGMPWAAIDECIDDKDFSFHPTSTAQEVFMATTDLKWLCQEEPDIISLACPRCQSHVADCSLTTAVHEQDWTDQSTAGSQGTGFADAKFEAACPCGAIINHDALRTEHFRKDLVLLMEDSVPMPGTLLDLDGQTQPASIRHVSITNENKSTFQLNFPSRFLRKGAGVEILRQWGSIATIDDIRSSFQTLIKDKSLVCRASRNGNEYRLRRGERIGIRRMMSSYWDNASIFSLDLVGATVRQSVFVQKMHDLGWVHSPSLSATMARLIQKYERFFLIMRTHPDKITVPTLDVDLAWHTHQLSPVAYRDYSLRVCKTLIDHDDKIDENKLSTSFEWTSKTYEKMFDAVYSECMCWYCQSVRASHTSSIGRLFGSKDGPVSKHLDELQSHASTDPNRAPHISAHNAIRFQDGTTSKMSHSVTDARLREGYNKAKRRAQRDGRKPPPPRDNGYYPYWGMMYPVPLYGPYMGDPCITGSMYAANPSCASIAPGAIGNCCSGTCGGGVAAGSCAGNCAGGAAGGCGGGGCGGGGGGGGCGGGGGGGGGCGGGGGGC
ncbi:hypothetical protein ANO11243_061810 [Dothideomycetidae sp. 11243]|nr:hypothetical protein ANO11243_061810 [fungal sp. No.11243]